MAETGMKDFEAIESTDVLAAARISLGIDGGDSSEDEAIKHITPDHLFNTYLKSLGLNGYTADILRAINNIRDAYADTRALDEWPFESDFIY